MPISGFYSAILIHVHLFMSTYAIIQLGMIWCTPYLSTKQTQAGDQPCSCLGLAGKTGGVSPQRVQLFKGRSNQLMAVGRRLMVD